MVRFEDDTKAVQYYNLALRYAPEQAADVKRECYEALSDMCFKRRDFSQCVEYGVKGYGVKPNKSEVRIASICFILWIVRSLNCKFSELSSVEQ